MKPAVALCLWLVLTIACVAGWAACTLTYHPPP